MAEKVKKNDIRWQRTERYLMQAFGDALQTQPIEKIKVTDLSKAAEINKATFYLHYHDVYDLAQAYARSEAKKIVANINDIESFFTEPRRFINSLISNLEAERSKAVIEALLNNRLMPLFMDGLTSSLDEEFKKVKPTNEDVESQVVVSFFVHGVMGAIGQNRNMDRDQLLSVLSNMLEAMTERGRKLDEIHRRIQSMSGQNPYTQNVIRGKDGKPIPLRDKPNKNSVNYWMELANRKLQ